MVIPCQEMPSGPTEAPQAEYTGEKRAAEVVDLALSLVLIGFSVIFYTKKWF